MVKFVLPETWYSHGHARLLLYVSNDIKYETKTPANDFKDLPTITLEIGLGRATKTTVHYYYREWTSGVTGDSSKASQLERQGRHVSLWQELAAEGRDMVLLGDGNLCALSWRQPNYKHTDLAKYVTDFLLEESCHQLVNNFTRIQNYANTVQCSCLDHVISNIPDKCSSPEIVSGGASDHMAVTVTKYSREVQNQPKTIKKRNYKHFNETAFLQDILEHVTNGAFDSVKNTTDPDIAAAHFSGIFGQILNKHAPLKTYQVRNNYVPWLSKNTSDKIILRDKLKVEASKDGDAEKHQAYTKLRNEIKIDVAKDEKDYYQNKFYSADTSVGSIWDSVNDYLGNGKKSRSNSPSLLSYNKASVTAPRDIANTFNKIFIDKVKRLRTASTGIDTTRAKERLKNWLESRNNEISEFNLKPIDVKKLRKILKKLKGNRSCGIDFIDGFSIKLAAPLIEDILLHLVNLNILQAKYPQLWKCSKVNPHHKKGERTNGENYRPVSDIVFVSKIAEAAVFEQTFQHFDENDLWHPNHHGFKPHHSTATAVAQLYDLWIQGAEEKELAAALLLDLSAAFDVVDHKILLEKIELYNFSQKTINWFHSYLQNRTQYVLVESRLSDPLPVGDQGVPQGSLLGPLCFIIYYNDFPAARDQGESVLYADDDTDTVSDPYPEGLQTKIQREANLSTNWVQDNKLVCSGDKTKLLVISTKELRRSRLAQVPKINITVAGHQVEESVSERLLGFVINNTLTWHNHLYGDEQNKGLIPKLSQRAGIIRKLSYVMPKSKLRTIANGVFFSLLSYGIQIYGSVSGLDEYKPGTGRYQAMTRKDSHSIQVIMNKVLRSLTNMDRETPIQLLLKTSSFLSFHQMCAFYTICLAKKIILNRAPKSIFEALNNSQPQHNRPRRDHGPVNIKYKLNISRESFLYQATKLYSRLPENVRSVSEIPEFKLKTRKWVEKNIPIYM